MQHRRVKADTVAKRRVRLHRALALPVASLLLASCSGVQSALDPAGEEASQVATLFWVMAIGGLVIWAAVVAISL